MAELLSMGELLIDFTPAGATQDGRLLFAQNPGKLITREAIRDALWDDAGAYIEENTLSVYIKRLRDKVEDDASAPKLIQTVRGLGYKACE